jgi:hypothetical protein
MTDKRNFKPSLSDSPAPRAGNQWVSTAQGEARRAAWVMGGFFAAVLVALVAVFLWFGGRPSREARMQDALRNSLAERVAQDGQDRQVAQVERRAKQEAVPVHRAPAMSPNDRLAQFRAYHIKKQAEEKAKGIQRPPTFGERIAAGDPTLFQRPPPAPFPFEYIHNPDGTVRMVRAESAEARKSR